MKLLIQNIKFYSYRSRDHFKNMDCSTSSLKFAKIDLQTKRPYLGINKRPYLGTP